MGAMFFISPIIGEISPIAGIFSPIGMRGREKFPRSLLKDRTIIAHSPFEYVLNDSKNVTVRKRRFSAFKRPQDRQNPIHIKKVRGHYSNGLKLLGKISPIQTIRGGKYFPHPKTFFKKHCPRPCPSTLRGHGVQKGSPV